MNAALLPLFVAVPMVAAAGLMGRRWSPRAEAAVLVGALGTHVVAAAALLGATRDGDILSHRVGLWPAELAISFAADAFAATMLTLTALVTLVVSLFAVRVSAVRRRFFATLVLLITAGVNGALLTADLFNLFVCIEIMLLPSYGLIITAKRAEGQLMQVTAARIYVAVNLLASSIMLIGLALIYAELGTVNLAALAGRGDDSAAALLGCGVFLMALAVKAGLVPVHGWVARTYPFMRPEITALFIGLHTKVAAYAIYRTYTVLFDTDVLDQVVLVVCLISIVVGALASLGEREPSAMISHQIVSAGGFILLGLAIGTPLALAAGVFYLIYDTLTKGSLFLVWGAVESAYGRHDLGGVRGLLAREPLAGLAFLLGALSLMGIPPTAGFVAKVAVLWSAFAAELWLAGALVLIASLVIAMAVLRIWSGAFLGQPESGDPAEGGGDAVLGVSGTAWTWIGPGLLLAGLSLAAGVAAAPVFDLCTTIAGQLNDPLVYVAAVMGR